MDTKSIKKVHVVFKTHLDIGYTDFSQTVLDRYVNEYIPASVRLATEINSGDKKKFIWTVGSYLIDYYLKNASDDEVKLLKSAIDKGYIAWHGLAMTTHTELMDEALLKYDLQISKRLDKQFGKTTVAAKMTDVPGHTKAMIPTLCESGIKYLHIGVNGASTPPSVPQVCRWQCDGQEILLHYSGDYGTPLVIDGFDSALEIMHTSDNRGPQSAQEVEAQLQWLQEKYPNAEVFASTLDDFAAELLKIRDWFPVLTQEIGDSWIHGVGTDPYKVAGYRALLRLKEDWLQSGELSDTTEGYDGFMTNLLLIAEHTWGKDFKTYLADYQNWAKKDFQAARTKDSYNCDENDGMYKHIHQGITSYSDFEASHEEQRQYLSRAVDALPEHLRVQANACLSAVKPDRTDTFGEQVLAGKTITVGNYKTTLGDKGQLTYLEKDGKPIFKNGEIGRMLYQVFDAKTISDYFHDYSVNLKWTQFWCFADFSKPGLQFLEDHKTAVFDFYMTGATVSKDNKLTVLLHATEKASETYGCPRKVRLTYDFSEDELSLTADCTDKDASRIPEGLWIVFNPEVENKNLWKLQKFGRPIDPLAVVRGGNRKLHAVEKVVYNEAGEKIQIENLDSPLVGIGGMHLYRADDEFGDLGRGFYFNLYNNCWATNFKMWYEEDIRSRFVLRFE